MPLTVSAINLYPVKSLGGISRNTAQLDFTGLRDDRRYMVVKPDGTFVTQRSHPQMALVATTLQNQQLRLESFGLESIKIPATSAVMHRLTTTVWGDKVPAIDLGDAIANWLTQAIDEECRLVAFPANATRQCNIAYSKPGDHTHFADAYPLLIVSRASLDDINQRLADKGDPTVISMHRFRPNIVVDGCDAFAEDDWQQLSINNLPVRIVAPCARCSVPTVDPETGVIAGPEPIHTLASYRQRDAQIFFGVNAVAEREGRISVGDVVTLT